MPPHRLLIMFCSGRTKMTGSTRSIIKTAKMLNRAGWDVRLLVDASSPIAPILRAQGLAVYEAPLKPSLVRQWLPGRFQNLLRPPSLAVMGYPDGPDGVFWTRNAINVLRLLAALGKEKRPIVWDVGTERCHHPLLIPLYSAIANRVSLVVTQGRSVSSALFGRQKSQACRKITHVLPAIDTARFERLKQVYFDCDSSSPPLLLSVGSIHPRKNQLSIVKALELVTERGWNVQAVFAGDIAKPRYGKRLHRLIERRGLHGIVTHTGWIDDVASFYKRATLMIHASKAEGLPHAVREAMVAGVPIIAHRTGAIPDVLEDNYSAALLDSASPPAIADAVIAMLADEQRRLLMATRAHREAAKIFDPYRWAEEYSSALAQRIY